MNIHARGGDDGDDGAGDDGPDGDDVADGDDGNADGDDGNADGDDFKQFTKRRTMLSSWSTLVTINTQLSSATPGKSQQIEFVTNIKNDRNK